MSKNKEYAEKYLGIIAATCIPGLGKSFRPTLVIVRRQVKTFRVPFVLYKEFGVMLVRIAHAVWRQRFSRTC